MFLLDKKQMSSDPVIDVHDKQCRRKSDMVINNTQLLRPLESIQRLIDAARPYSVTETYKAGRHTELPIEDVFMMEDGLAALHRDSGKQLLIISAAPLVIGMRSLFFPQSEVYTLQFISDTSLLRLPNSTFMAILDEQHLWKDAAHLLAFHLLTALEQHSRQVKRSDYDIIRALILEYELLSPIVRQATPLAHYIVNKGLLSRSNVMRILSMLDKMGYITLRRGRLEHVDYLPPII